MPKDECIDCGIQFKYVGEGPKCESCMAADSVDLQSELNAVKGRLKEVREEHDKAMSHISTLEVEVWRLVEERDNAKADMLLECLRYYDNTDHKISLFDWMTRREKELRKPIRRRHNEPRTR